jgi:hypothetical protein
MPPKIAKRTTTVKNSRQNYDNSVSNSVANSPSCVDTDIESEVEPLDADVAYDIQAAQASDMRDLNDFFDASMINKPNNPSTNIINRQYFKCYNVPAPKLPKMFKLLEICRRNKQRLMFLEKQQDMSGIMLDFDIYQDTEEDQITDEIIHSLCQKIIELLIKILNFKDAKKETFHIGITRRPRITLNNEKKCYKDGFHLLIPSIKVSRGVKRLIISKLLKSAVIDQIMADVKPADIKAPNGEQYQHKHFLDVMSASVPIFFIGSSTKKGAPPYILTHIYEVTVNFVTKSIMYDRNKTLMNSKSFNVCHEFSVNYECPGGVIRKIEYDSLDTFNTELIEVTKIQKQEEEIQNNFGELSLHSMHDIQQSELKALLDMLAPDRCEKYEKWYPVLCALANGSPSYKALAEYFSRKSAKFRASDFEKFWNQALRGPPKTRKGVSVGSIHHWAKIDNEEKYNEFRKETVRQVLYRKVYESYKEGILNHADIADLLVQLLKYKYITDRPKNGKKRVWYEFVDEEDQRVDGELYKWRAWEDEQPVNMSRYISLRLPNLFEKVLKSAKKNYDAATSDLTKYHRKVLDNLKATMRKLGDRQFKRSVIDEAALHFSQCGFAELLDKDPLVRGVQNGILKLGDGKRYAQLIQGYHTYKVSKYTDVAYEPFNPYDRITKVMLIALRSMFPDDESDTFEFTMSFLASTLDGNPKESMIMLMVGKGSNGKSALVELHKSAIGEIYGVKMNTSFLTSKNNAPDAATPAIMQLKDATFAYYSETNKHEVLNAARMKEITGQETLTGRRLNENLINFKPKCHHLVLSNNDFDIISHDHGTWRRVIYNPLKIKFVDTTNERYDPSDPYQRIANPDIQDKWPMEPEVQSRYLGFMVWMHHMLYKKFNGKVKAVPHPHVQFETEKYRIRQDIISEFLAQRMVTTAEATSQTPLIDEIQKYITWYAKNHSNVLPPKGITEQFQNSPIGKHIKSTKRGLFLEGHRFLDSGESPGAGEDYAMKGIFDLELSPEAVKNIVSESPEEYYVRICKEYDEYKDNMNTNSKFDIDVQTSLFLQRAEAEDAPKVEIPVIEERSDNLEINGRILSNGVVIKELEGPKHNYGNMSNYEIDISKYVDLEDGDDSDVTIYEDSADEREDELNYKQAVDANLKYVARKTARKVVTNISKNLNSKDQH